MIENSTDIRIFGAAENNLKKIDVRIPLNKITCITGKSGSGKSSLVQGIIARESQRLHRIVAGTATDFEKHVRADFLHIENLPDSVFIKQDQAMRTVSSSIATYSGLSDGLRKLFTDFGEIVCNCGKLVDDVVDKDKITGILGQVLTDQPYHFYSLISTKTPIDINLLKRFRAEYNIDKFVIDDNLKALDINEISKLSKHKKFTVKALIGSATNSSLVELKLSRFPTKTIQVFHAKTCLFNFKRDTFCHHCFSQHRSKSISLFTRAQLSRDSGACVACAGVGATKVIDFSTFINANRSIIDTDFLNLPNNGKAYKYVNLQNSYMLKFSKENSIDTSLIFKKFSKKDQSKILNFLEVKLESYIDHDQLQNHVIERPCLDCHGSGFNHHSLSVQYNKKTIADVLRLSLSEALTFFSGAEFHPILNALNKLSLGHLALDRRTNTLSGGELQRLKLAEVIIQKSEPLLLIIDEPSLGLHYQDLNNLLLLFRELAAQKNTLLLIDHHPWIIANSDHHIEIGPGSGAQGGNLVIPEKLKRKTPKPWIKTSIQDRSKIITFENINFHNIYQERVTFPSHQLVCITGVSGSGKSSLAQYIKKEGSDQFDEVISLSQHSIGKNKRSTIATYLNIADDIRTIYATTKRAKFLGLNKSDFNCSSQLWGSMPNAGLDQINDLPCFDASNCFFNPFTLSVVVDEINISEFLRLPVNEMQKTAPDLFACKKLNKTLLTIIEIGLGHLSLDREIPSISGGEAQRVKLAKYLTQHDSSISNPNKHNLLILDEPCQGLNSSDSIVVLELLRKLVDHQNTLLVIEHNDAIVDQADFIIELGPQAGHLGGKITFAGNAEDFLLKKPDYQIAQHKPVRAGSSTELYPSAVANNRVDHKHFERLEQIFLNYDLAPIESNVVYFVDKQQMRQHYLSKFSQGKLFFNPFNIQFIKSPFVSREQIDKTLFQLEKFNLDNIRVDDTDVSLRQASSLINNTNCWSALVDATDFNQAFELGGGWIVAQSDDAFWHLSVPLLSVQEKIFGPRSVSKDSLNPFYNRCQYCDGHGEVDFSEVYILNSNLSILDVDFYRGDFAQVMKTKLLRKLKLVAGMLNQQGLFDLTKPFKMFDNQDLIIYEQGLPGHKFLKNGGRDTAKGDIIEWHGMTRFFLENIKYFPAQAKQSFVASVIQKKCQACGGTGCNKRLSYYLDNMHNGA